MEKAKQAILILRQNLMKIVTFMVVMVTKNLIATKESKKKKNKGNINVNNFKGKKNIQAGLVSALYSMTRSFSIDWIVDSRCTNHLCFENDNFENFHKYRKDAVVIGDNSILEVQGIESVLIHRKVLENVLYIPKLVMNLLSIIQVVRK